MSTANLNVAHTSDGVSTQLNLPSGPLGIVRPRRERTDEDREWYSKQLSVQHVKRIDKLVFERMAFYGSLNPDRTAYPSVKRLAGEAMCSERSVQYAVRRLESVGLIECLYDKGGRVTSRYRVVGSTDCRAGVQTVHPRAANRAPEVLREGKRVSKNTSLSADAQTLDPGAVEALTLAHLSEIEQEQGEVIRTPLPSQEQKQEKAPVPIADEPVFENPAQVGMLCSVARKLDYSLSDAAALRFDGLNHVGKKAILDRLLTEEQDKALHGEVAPPPKKPRAPRAEVAVEKKPKPDRPSCVGKHRLTAPASDGISNCFDCDHEEKTNE